MKNHSYIGQKIKNVRKNLNMSQSRFGMKIGVSGKTISSYETGRSIPPLKILESISTVYKIDFVKLNSDKRKLLEDKVADIKYALEYIESTLSETLSF